MRYNKSSVKTISKSIGRLSNQCWDILVARGLVGKYIGAEIGDIHAPRDIIIYLAFYSHLGVPFFTAMEQAARVKWEPQREGGGAAPPSGRLSQYRGFRTGGAEMGAVPLHFHNLY